MQQHLIKCNKTVYFVNSLELLFNQQLRRNYVNVQTSKNYVVVDSKR